MMMILDGLHTSDLGNNLIQHLGNGSVDEIVAVLLHELDDLGRFVGDDIGVVRVGAVAAVLGDATNAYRGDKTSRFT